MASALVILLLAEVAWLAAMVAGIALIARGIRGRIEPGPAHCAQCLYIVGGVPRVPECCSECGTLLLAVGSVNYGRRVRHGRQVGWGSGIVVACVTVATGALWPLQVAPIAPAPVAAAPVVVTPAAPVVAWLPPSVASARVTEPEPETGGAPPDMAHPVVVRLQPIDVPLPAVPDLLRALEPAGVDARLDPNRDLARVTRVDGPLPVMPRIGTPSAPAVRRSRLVGPATRALPLRAERR